jgi:beta-fructofuranosidase
MLLMALFLAAANAADVPCQTGPFARVFVPANGRYLNDHTLIRARDGTWHLYGITHTSQGSAFEERSLLHATAPALAGPWTEQSDALYADDALDELVVWAPHVVEWRPGNYVMYYWGEWLKPNDLWRGIRRADSTNLVHWSKLETAPDPSVRPPGGRDPYLMRDGDHWLLYSVGVEPDSRGLIVATQSPDLKTWSDADAVITDPTPVFGWGNLESPFVEKHDGRYYLFVTDTGPNEPAEYLREEAFVSTDPLHFDWNPVANFQAHASEIVHEADRTYITSAGWTSVIGEENRGLKLAPLGWCQPLSSL